jgi:hypothetical protein
MLTDSLIRYLANSRLSVASFAHADNTLTIHITNGCRPAYLIPNSAQSPDGKWRLLRRGDRRETVLHTAHC